MPTKRRLGAPLILMFGVIIALVAFAAPANAAGQGPYQGQGGGGGGQGPYQGQGQGPHHRHPTVSVSHERARAGDRVQCRGTGFDPGERVTIGSDNHRVGQRHQSVGRTTYPSAVADSSGAVFSTFVLEANFTGTQTITVTGTTSGAAASVPIVVAGVSANASPPAAAASRPAAAGLAFTGAAVLGIGSLGGLLLVGGAALVLAGRRRKVDA